MAIKPQADLSSLINEHKKVAESIAATGRAYADLKTQTVDYVSKAGALTAVHTQVTIEIEKGVTATYKLDAANKVVSASARDLRTEQALKADAQQKDTSAIEAAAAAAKRLADEQSRLKSSGTRQIASFLQVSGQATDPNATIDEKSKVARHLASVKEMYQADKVTVDQIKAIWREVGDNIVKSYTDALGQVQTKLIALKEAQLQVGDTTRRRAESEDAAAARIVQAAERAAAAEEKRIAREIALAEKAAAKQLEKEAKVEAARQKAAERAVAAEEKRIARETALAEKAVAKQLEKEAKVEAARQKAAEKEIARARKVADAQIKATYKALDVQIAAAQKAATAMIKAIDKKVAAEKKEQEEIDKTTAKIVKQAQAREQAKVAQAFVARISAGVDASIAPRDAANRYFAAQDALEKYVSRNKISQVRLDQIHRDVVNNTRATYGEVENTVRQRVAGVIAAQENLGAASQRMQDKIDKSIKSVIISWQGMLRLFATSVARRALFSIISATKDAIKETTELEIKYAEIRTISQKNQLTTDEWSTGLRRLSDSFGVDIINQAEGAYQTLSNQVTSGAEAFQFLAAANRFAIAAVTDSSNAVNLLTSVINAYGLSVSDTDEISAQLFKTIELGRVRAEELSKSFGTVLVPAEALGIDVTEVSAAIATLTLRGQPVNKAMTQLRALMLKLIQPTDEMKKFLSELGVETGQAAIATFGFTGFLKLLEERVKGDATELGKLAGRLRATQGLMGLSGKAGEDYADTLLQIQNSTESYGKAQELVFESTGKNLQIQMNKVRNYFIEEVGRTLLDNVKAWTDAFGSLDIHVRALSKLLTGVFVAAVGAAVISIGLALAASNPLTLAIVATTAAMGLLAQFQARQEAAAEEILRQAEETTIRVVENAKREATDKLKIYNEDVEQYIQAQKRATAGAIAEINSRNKFTKEAISSFDELIEIGVKATTSSLKEQIKILEDYGRKAEAQIKANEEFLEKLRADNEQDIYDKTTSDFGATEKLAADKLRLAALFAQSRERVQKNDTEGARKTAERIIAFQKDIEKQEDDIIKHNQANEQKRRTIELAKMKSTEKYALERYRIEKKYEDALKDLRREILTSYEKQEKRRKALLEQDKALIKSKQDQELEDNTLQRRLGEIKDLESSRRDFAAERLKVEAEIVEIIEAATAKEEAVKTASFALAAERAKLLAELEVQAKRVAAKSLEEVLRDADTSTPEGREKLAGQLQERRHAAEKLIALEKKANIDVAETEAIKNKYLIEEKRINDEIRIAKIRELEKERDLLVEKNKIIVATATEELANLKARGVLLQRAAETASEISGAFPEIGVKEENVKSLTSFINQFREGGVSLTKFAEIIKREVSKLPSQDELTKLFKEQKPISMTATGGVAGGGDKITDARKAQIAQFVAAVTDLADGVEQTTNQAVESEKNLTTLISLYNERMAAQVKVIGDVKAAQDESATVQKESLSTLYIFNAQLERQLAIEQEILNIRHAKSSPAPYFEAPQFKAPALYAAGGSVHGSDTIPALLSPGEFVVNAKSARRFYSQLVGINSGTRHFASGGPVTNVGDVNVSINSTGAASKDVAEIGRLLKREIRRGTLTL